MKLKHWAWLQIALGVADAATTPWHNLSLEANPIIRHGGAPAMLAFKVAGIWLFTKWWKMYDTMWWRAYLAAVATAPVLVVVAWNVTILWRR